MVGEARQSVMCTVPKLNLFFPIFFLGGEGRECNNCSPYLLSICSLP